MIDIAAGRVVACMANDHPLRDRPMHRFIDDAMNAGGSIEHARLPVSFPMATTSPYDAAIGKRRKAAFDPRRNSLNFLGPTFHVQHAGQTVLIRAYDIAIDDRR
jgi:hypothetical protein